MTGYSANTEYVICDICSGQTVTLDTPHAIYSNAQGVDVVQLNTVVIGGPNGVNS